MSIRRFKAAPMRNGERMAGNGENNGEQASAPSIRPVKRPVVITGGAGFIGTNLADRYLSAGQAVILYDNLSRAGVEQNWKWLRQTHGSLVQLEEGDVRDARRLGKVVREASQVFHFASQVAVTTSLVNPIEDFEVNARGTLNLLEGLRALDNPPPLIFTSTNKVYGDLLDVALEMNKGRYEPKDSMVRQHGFGEDRPLHFHSPYGCSKGSAGQYVLDYARTFQVPGIVFRMSCIYGPHQFGTEDQGWVAHFIIRGLEQGPITIYGDGRQVRDILFVDDLVNAFLLGQKHIGTLAGEAFNIGGGPRNTISLLELLKQISELQGGELGVDFDEWRTADQRYYVSDIRKFSQATGWVPRVGVRAGITRLYQWLQESRRLAEGAIIRVPELAQQTTGNGANGKTVRPELRKAGKPGAKVKGLFRRSAKRFSGRKLAKAV